MPLKVFLPKEHYLGYLFIRTWRIFKGTAKIWFINHITNIKFIDKNHAGWKRIDMDWQEPLDYFNSKHSKKDTDENVEYDDYLVNHTRKQAMDLKEYHEKSVSLDSDNETYLIDPIPPLTETGGGTLMALFDGCSAETTEQFIGAWCGDLLQIVDHIPDSYEQITCCFASIWERASYCKINFGLDDEQFILKNKNKERYEATALSPYLRRGRICNIQYEQRDDRAFYKPVYGDE